MEDNPEFQKALKEACDEQWRNYLYGGDFKTVPREDVEEELKNLQRVKQEAQKIEMDAQRTLQDAKRRIDSARKRVDMAKIRAEKYRTEARIMRNPMLRRVVENLESDVKSALVCPECGKGDTGNRMNRKPWCVWCHVPLINREDVGKRGKVKVLGKGFGDDTLRKVRGLPDDGGITKGRGRKRRRKKK